LVYGNRGCLHDETGRIRRRYNGKRWIACRLQFRGWHRAPLLQPGRIWREFHPGHAGADAIDQRLHDERVAPGTREQLRYRASLDELPDGAFVLRDDAPWLVVGPELLRWTPAGYVDAGPRPNGAETVLITPPSLVAVLRAGWRPVVPLLHPSALAATD
jgi:hypothetical protein